jgi:UDP-N-acetylglucosamine 3-dehydrogenase
VASRELGVAVIGCGSTAERRHLPVWQALPGARLAVVVSRDPARAEAARARYGADRALTDWRAAVALPEVDVVDVCVPHPLHAEVAVAAARAGKHVLCEKPLAPDLAAAEAMAAAAAAAGVVLLPFHNMRLLGPVRTALRLVREGRVGRPVLFRGAMTHGGPDASDPRRRWFLEASAGGGAVLDLGPHLFDLVRALHPVRATRLRAAAVRPAGMAVERDGVVDVEFADGAVARLLLSWSQVAGRETSLVVHGTDGTLRLTLLQTPEPARGAPPAPLALAEGRGPAAAVSYPDPEPGEEPCAVMLRAVRGEPVPLRAEDGVEAVRWVDAAYRSDHAGGAWVSLAGPGAEG